MKIIKFIYKIKYYILIFLIMEFLFISIIMGNKLEKEKKYRNTMTKYLYSEYLSIINKYELVTKTIFNMEINKEKILKTVKKVNFTSENEKKILREELFVNLNDTYLYLKSLGLNIFHFHLLNGESFLRFHKIDKFGDYLFDKRYSLKLVNEKKIYMYGYEKGKVISGFRYIYPLFLNKEYIGSVEFMLSIDIILNEIKKIFPATYQFIIKKDIVKAKSFDKYYKNYIISDISNNFLYQKNIFENMKSIDTKIVKELNLKIKDEFEKNLSKNSPFSKFKNLNGEIYLITAIPIFNFENKKIAYILSYKNVEDMKFAEKNFLIVNLMFSIFLTLVLFFIYKIFRKNETLEIAKNKALQAVKTREIFIANISHELRTPLNSIINFTDIIIEDFDEMLQDKEVQKEHKLYLSRSLENSKHLLDLINDILEFSRAEAGKITYNMKKQNIIPIVIESANNLKNLAKDKSIEFKIEIEYKSIFINIDKKRLKQIMNNLISNAIKFTSKGFIKISLIKKDKKIILKVIDSGKGIDDNKKEAIFNPFEQINSFDTGSGLGLSLVKTMCKDMNIKLDFTSKVNMGTTFILEFNEIN